MVLNNSAILHRPTLVVVKFMVKIVEKLGTRLSAVFENTQKNFQDVKNRGILPAIVDAGERMGTANRNLIKRG